MDGYNPHTDASPYLHLRLSPLPLSVRLTSCLLLTTLAGRRQYKEQVDFIQVQDNLII